MPYIAGRLHSIRMRIIRIWPHVSRETFGDRQNSDALMVSRETLQKRSKSLFLQGFLARGRQCESEVSNLWVVSTKKCVCYQQLSLLSVFWRGRAHYSAKAIACQEFFRVIA